MPTKIAEDEYTVTFQNEDGSLHTVEKKTADKLGIGTILPEGNQLVPEPEAVAAPTPPEPFGAGGPPLPPAVGRAPNWDVGMAAPGQIEMEPEPAAGRPAGWELGTPTPEQIELEPDAPVERDVQMAAPEDIEMEPDEPTPEPESQATGRSAVLQTELAGIEQQKQAQQAYHRGAADAMEKGIEEQSQMRAAGEAKSREEEAALAARRVEMDARAEEISNFKPERGRFWASRSTSQKIMAGIGMALSGLGSALKHRGGENMALDIINKAIADDISDQMAAFGSKKAGFAKMQWAYSQAAGAAKDQAAQRELAMAAGWKNVERQFLLMGEKSKDQQVAAAAKVNAAQAAAKYLGHVEGAAKAEQDQANWERQQEATEKHRKAQIGLGYAKLARQEAQFEAKMQLERDKLNAKGEEAASQGAIINPWTKKPFTGRSMFGAKIEHNIQAWKDTSEAHEGQVFLTNYIEALKKAGRVNKVLGMSEMLKSQEYADLASMHLQYSWILAREYNGARLSKEDQQVAAKIAGGGPQGMLQRAEAIPILDRMRRTAKKKHGVYLSGLNMPVAEREWIEGAERYYRSQPSAQAKSVATPTEERHKKVVAPRSAAQESALRSERSVGESGFPEWRSATPDISTAPKMEALESIARDAQEGDQASLASFRDILSKGGPEGERAWEILNDPRDTRLKRLIAKAVGAEARK
jgi:hypothetical protein